MHGQRTLPTLQAFTLLLSAHALAHVAHELAQSKLKDAESAPNITETEAGRAVVERIRERAAEAEQTMQHLQKDVSEKLGDLHGLASTAWRAFTDAPTSLDDAERSHGIAVAQYSRFALDWAAAQSTVDQLEDETGRVRRECAREIEQSPAGTKNGKPLSDTALQAAAGDHPRYVELRQKLVDAKETRDGWFALRESMRLRCEYLAACVETQRFRLEHMPQVTLQRTR